MAKHIGIDLGTSNTVISLKNTGVILNEPSVVAIDVKTNQIVAAGKEAKELLGKTSKDICVISPISNGVVSDFDSGCAMLKTFIASAFSKGAMRPKATVCMPHGITDVEARALTECISRSNVKTAYTFESSIAASLGAGIDVSSPSGNMILDLGGGKICATVMSFGGVVSFAASGWGGDKMDLEIVDYLKENCGILIGKKTAEDLKISLGAFSDTEKSVTVMGRDTKTGLPKEITVTTTDICEALTSCFAQIIDVIKRTLENTPAELIKDIIDHGIYLCGGVANLAGLDKFIEKNVNIRTHLCENTFECVSLGATSVFDRG